MTSFRNIVERNLNNHNKLITFKWTLSESFTFDNYNVLEEDAANDEYNRRFARYITDKICRVLESYLTKQEKQMIKNKSIEYLKNVQSDSFSKLFPLFSLSINSFTSDEYFPTFNVNLKPIHHKFMAAFVKDNTGISLELYIMQGFDKVNLGYLKNLICNKENIDHEIIYFLDSFKTNAFTQKQNEDEYNSNPDYYYNFPSEYHAYGQQIMSRLYDRYNQFGFKHKDIENILNSRTEDDFFMNLQKAAGSKTIKKFIRNLNVKNKKNFIKRIRNYILEKQLNESAIDDYRYEVPYVEKWNEKTYEKLFDDKDEALYIKFLYESLPQEKFYINFKGENKND